MSKTVEEKIIDALELYTTYVDPNKAIEAINQLLIEAKLEAVQLVRVYLNEEMERFEPSEVFDSAALLAKISNYEQTIKGLDLGE